MSAYLHHFCSRGRETSRRCPVPRHSPHWWAQTQSGYPSSLSGSFHLSSLVHLELHHSKKKSDYKSDKIKLSMLFSSAVPGVNALIQIWWKVKSASQEKALNMWCLDLQLLLFSLPPSLHLLASDGRSLLTSSVTSAVSVCDFHFSSHTWKCSCLCRCVNIAI